ncbi:MAG: ABC transporter substrate-binding protein [Pseudomonadota bacterium]
MVALMLSPCIAKAEASRKVTDDVGRSVDIPIEPQRIVTNFDPLTGLPLIELGLPVVGAEARVWNPDGSRDVFGLKELFGKSASEVGITPVQNAASMDIEKVAQLSPDLIVLTEFQQEQLPLLEQLAPVYVFESFTENAFGLDGVRRLARGLAQDERLVALDTRYNRRIATLRASLAGKTPDDPSYVLMPYTDQMWLFTGAGAVHEVMDDLGFRQPDWVVEPTRASTAMALSPESLRRLDVDLVFISPNDGDDTEDKMRRALDRIAPGWHLVLEDERLIFLNSSTHLSTTFASAHVVIDYVAAHYGVPAPPLE